MIAIKDIAKIRKDVMDEFVAQWRLSEERWKISPECERKLNRLAEMLEQLNLFDYLLDLRLSLSQIAFLNDLSKKELKEAILFDGNGIGLDPEDLGWSRVRRQLRLFDETFETFLREFVKEYQDADDTESLVRELANSLAFEVEKGIREGIRKRNELLMKGDQTCQ